MSGSSKQVSTFSYLGVGRETTLGTYNTCTADFSFLSSGLKTTQENKLLEEITGKRVYKELIKMGKVIEGEIEGYFRPEQDASNYILQNAMGGAITSATATGDTVGGTAFEHTYEIGTMDNSYTSLCFNQRKGDSAEGKVFEYSGCRVNELTLMSELDESLKLTGAIIGIDSSSTSNDIGTALTLGCSETLSFVRGRVSVENSFASLTSSSFWYVQSAELTMANSLKSDNESRSIGRDTLDILPVGIADIQLSLSMRFDTLTAYNAMLNKTQLSGQLQFEGSTIPGSTLRRSLTINLPKIFVNDSGDPEIGGPDEILTSDVVFHVLHDCSSAGGYAMQAKVVNAVANYD